LGLLERINAITGGGETRSSIDTWLSDYLMPSTFGYNGNVYGYGGNQLGLGLTQTLAGSKAQQFSSDLPGHAAAVRSSPPAFAAQMVRALVLSQIRFTFRNPQTRKLFGRPALSVLEKPWPRATTGELVARMEWHAGLAGNAYVTNWSPGRLRVLRPDWVAIVYGSQLEPDDPALAIDSDVLGYVYRNGGLYGADNSSELRIIFPDQMAHWSPLPDPLNAGLGMSWLTPAIRDIQGDSLATQHKISFFTNGATPNMVVKGIASPTGEKLTKAQFDDIVDMLEARHTGVRNAYKTLYLTAGADATVVGSDLKQMDFTSVQGRGETRISVLSRVPAPLLGISEGLAGSSLNAGNFGMARRMFADTWVYPTAQDLAAALAPLVRVPADAELWPDTADMPILREDAKDAAEIMQIESSTVVSLSSGGFTRDSAKAAVAARDVTLLVPDPNWVSVQLQQSNGAAKPQQPHPGQGGNANGG
jgi:phage portal protein BeeE